MVEWDIKEILKSVGGYGVFTTIALFIAKRMDWIRFGKTDAAKVDKVNAETALDLASVAEKEIEKEVKISTAALQWNINLASRLEKALSMVDAKQEIIERLYGVIEKMKEDFDKSISKMKDDFNRDIEKVKSSYDKRIGDIKKEFEHSKKELLAESEKSKEEIRRLKEQIHGNT